VLSRRVWVFAHDPAPHESAENSLAAWLRRLYFRFIYYRKRWRAVIVGSERNREVLQAGGCASPTAVQPFPVFGSDLFEQTPPEETPELGNVRGYILFFGRVDVYKGVHDWLAEQAGDLDRPIVIAGRVIDDRVLRFDDRAIFINRFIRNGEVAELFGRAAALICPYLSATHSGVVDLGLSYGLPVYVSQIPYFIERYEGVEGVRWVEDLPGDLAAQCGPLAAGGRPA
jgi:glycosyltransferase involved in cell wall biosynthesis